MDRRNFTRLCSSLVAGASALSLGLPNSKASANSNGISTDASSTETGAEGAYPACRLLDSGGQPLTVGSLVEGSSSIFSYPYKTTPCFLLRLSNANVNRRLLSEPESDSNDEGKVILNDSKGNSYEWKGGIGPQSSIVAFSAICTHKMSHPAKPVSHLNFRPEEKIFRDRIGNTNKASELIYCCSEHSVYDPAAGARVLSGPASQPLAAIELTVNQNDELQAVGTYGSNMFELFLEKFGFRQAMEQGIADPYELVGDSVRITEAQQYSKLQILC